MRTATKPQIDLLIAYLKSGTTCTSFVIHELSGVITAHVYPNRLYNPARYKLNTQLAVVYNLPAQVVHTLITLYPNNCRVCAKL
jgi:hypothetical protein